MHARNQIIIPILRLAYITQALHIWKNLKTNANASKHMNMHKSNAINQVHELAPPTCVLLLSKNFDPPLFFNVAPIWSMSMLALSSPLYLFFLTFHIFVQISPPLSSMTIKGPTPYEICAMWRSMNTTWRLYHENFLWLDAKSWTRVDGWILNFHFWWTLPIDWNWHHL